MEWKDVSSYSRNEKIEPKTFIAIAGPFKLCITRRLRSEGWYLMCEDLHFDEYRLNDDFETAKKEALALVRSKLNQAMAALSGE